MIEGSLGKSCGIASGKNQGVGTEDAEFSGKAAPGVHLKVEESRSYGGACAKGKQNDEQAAAVGAKQSADNPPEHLPIAEARCRHHSPLRIGAGS